jgi:hypothetical protein
MHTLPGCGTVVVLTGQGAAYTKFMAEKKLHLMLETSYLKGVSLNDPDLRKLLEHCKGGAVRIFAPHIVWEERRTQLAQAAWDRVRKVSDSYEALRAKHATDFILGGLPAPALAIWKQEEIDAQSRKAMAAYARENKIEVVPIAADHTERAWNRYFGVGAPFNPNQDREDRRKDIPDSWIFEAALDLKATYPDLKALCADGALSSALEGAGIRVYKKTPEILAEIEARESPQPLPRIKWRDTAPVGEDRRAEALGVALTASLTEVQAQFQDVETKVLGYVTYLRSATKDQLFELLGRVGVPIENARNAAERLALGKVIRDTGNHYLPGNKEAGELAAQLIEGEIIQLLESEEPK